MNHFKMTDDFYDDVGRVGEDDWFYTFEDETVYDEQSLLEYKTYKKN